jgi:hypothetical protein
MASYIWDATILRYRDAAGTVVPEEVVRTLIEQLAEDGKAYLQTVTARYLAGDSTLSEWYSDMRAGVKGIHVAAGVLAGGGYANMNQSGWGYIGRMVQVQYQYLTGFAAELRAQAEGNLKERAAGQLQVRAGMYADAAFGSYQQMTRRGYANAGYKEERRVLDPGAEHCRDCERAARAGWSALGSLPRIGDSDCLTNCRCRFEYR